MRESCPHTSFFAQSFSEGGKTVASVNGRQIPLVCFLFILFILVSPSYSDNFSGFYNPMVEYDWNISDGVLIQQDSSHTLDVPVADPSGHRMVTIADGAANTADIDTIESALGDRIYNPERPVAYEGWNLLDFIMVSDGTNKACVIIGQEDYDPSDISFTVASWSDVTVELSTSGMEGSWFVTTYSDPNLRNVEDSFTRDVQAIDVIAVSEVEISVTISTASGEHLTVPMQVSGNTARLVNPPITTADGIWHTLQVVSDGVSFSLCHVGTEVDDLTDVSVGIGLGTRALPGDATGDGFVGADDLVKILTYWGQSGLFRLQGDLTGDGFVGADDYVEVLTYWATGTPSAPIPEPTTLTLLLSITLIILRQRKK